MQNATKKYAFETVNMYSVRRTWRACLSLLQRPMAMTKLNFDNMGLINKVDMVCLSPVGYGV